MAQVKTSKAKGSSKKKLGRPARAAGSVDMKVVLIEHYLKLCKQHGGHAVTLQMLSKEAGVSFSTVHYYFGGPSKDIVVEAIHYIVNHGQMFVSDLMAKEVATTLEERLETYIQANLKWVQEYPSYASHWIFQFYLGGTSPVFKKMYLEASKISYARVGSWVDEFIARKQVKEAGREQIVAQTLTWLLGLFTTVTAGGAEVFPRKKDWIRTGVDSIVRPYLVNR